MIEIMIIVNSIEIEDLEVDLIREDLIIVEIDDDMNVFKRNIKLIYFIYCGQ